MIHMSIVICMYVCSMYLLYQDEIMTTTTTTYCFVLGVALRISVVVVVVCLFVCLFQLRRSGVGVNFI